MVTSFGVSAAVANTAAAMLLPLHALTGCSLQSTSGARPNDVATALHAPSARSPPKAPSAPLPALVDQCALREAHSRATAHAAAAAENALKLPYRAGAISKEQYKEVARAAVRTCAARLAPRWAAAAPHGPAATSHTTDEEAAAARGAVMEALHAALPALFP
jgi:hypothetical protein